MINIERAFDGGRTVGKYMVRFEFLNKLGEWVPEVLSNDGTGFTKEEAENVLKQLQYDEVCTKRNLRIELL